MYGFVEESESWREEIEDLANWVFFAENSISWYAYNLASSQHELLDNGCADVMDVFPSFDALLTRAFKDSIDVELLKTPLPEEIMKLVRSRQ